MFWLKKFLKNTPIFCEYCFVKTLYFNFKVFSWKIAIHLPVHIFSHVEMHGLYKGCVKFQDDTAIRGGLVRIGFAKYPVFPVKNAGTLVRFEPGGVLTLGSDVILKFGCSLCVYKNASLSIASDFYCNSNSAIYCKNNISIGAHCRIGWSCQLYDSNFHFIYDEKTGNIGKCHGSISLMNNVWLANQCTVVKGAKIPPYSMVASGSIVNKDFSELKTRGNCLGGRPAKLLTSGKIRILNNDFEQKLLKFFEEHPETDFYSVESMDKSWFEN